jgi:AcrR family transcriptional regulator
MTTLEAIVPDAVAPFERRSQARGRATRERLLAAAKQLFTRKGYDATAMADIAKAAGVGIGTLYHHLPDKRALLLELVDRWGDKVAAQRRSELDFEAFLGSDPRAAFLRWLEQTYRRLKQEPSLYLVVLSLAQRDAEVRKRYGRIEQLAIERLASLIEFGQRRGLMRPALEPRAVAFLVHHSLDMAVAQLLLHESSGIDAARVLHELGEMICRHLLEERHEHELG